MSSPSDCSPSISPSGGGRKGGRPRNLDRLKLNKQADQRSLDRMNERIKNKIVINQ
jgi:hypothetical protein